MTTLITDRLRLSPHDPADLDELAAMWADPSVPGPIGLPPLPREDVWNRLLRYVGHWQVLGWGSFIVRERATGALVGEALLMDSRRDTDPGFEGVPEAGWALAAGTRGRGYAAEAVAAMLGWADARGIGRTVAIIAPENIASIRVAERVGFCPAGEIAYKNGKVRLFERFPLS